MDIPRRNFLKGAGILSASSVLAFSQLTAYAHEKQKLNIKRSLRIAHLTDIHILDKPEVSKAVAGIYTQLQSMKDKPDFIINTGDSLMDMNNQTKERIDTLWKAWDHAAATHSFAVKSCLGNHDVWYLPKEHAAYEQSSKDPLYGKKWAMTKLGLPQAYYSFEQKGWKFIALDSINYNSEKGGYTFGQEQLDWLTEELAQTSGKTPVVLFSHVPIISVTPLLYAAQRTPILKMGFPGGDQHVDVMAVKSILKQHPNVRVALSGHVHYVDHVSYLGVNYYCGGAVSGNWWNGVLDDFAPAYSILDLYEDGSSHYETIYY